MKRARQRSAAAAPAAAPWLLVAAAVVTLLQPANAAAQHKTPYEGLLVLPSRESANDKFGLTILKAQPVIDEATEEAVRRGLVPKDWLKLRTHDSRYWEDVTLAERWSTVGVVDAYCEKKLDMVLGFADSYGLATVTKISAGFGAGIPVLTTAGLPSMLHSRKSYPYLIRMQGSYRHMAAALYKLIAYQDPSSLDYSPSSPNYAHMLFMYHDKKRAVNKVERDETTDSESVSSHCYFSLYAIKNYFTEHSPKFKELWSITTPSHPFDEEVPRTTDNVKDWLKEVSMKTNGALFL